MTSYKMKDQEEINHGNGNITKRNDRCNESER